MLYLFLNTSYGFIICGCCCIACFGFTCFGFCISCGIVSSSLNSSKTSTRFNCFFFILIAFSINFFSNSCFLIKLFSSFSCLPLSSLASKASLPFASDSNCFSVRGFCMYFGFFGFSGFSGFSLSFVSSSSFLFGVVCSISPPSFSNNFNWSNNSIFLS